MMLLSHLAVLLKPEVPVAELFRDFPMERSAARGANLLSPDLAVYGVLKKKHAAVFLEYDGYYRHHHGSGVVADERKTEAFLQFAPAGSVVLRIAHAHRGLKARRNFVEVVVDWWNVYKKEDVLAPLLQIVGAMLEELDGALQAPLRRQLQGADSNASRWCCTAASIFLADAEFTERDPELQLAQLRVFLEKLGVNPTQNGKGFCPVSTSFRL